MCYRYETEATDEELAIHFRAALNVPPPQPTQRSLFGEATNRQEHFPLQAIPGIRQVGDERVLSHFTWGLLRSDWEPTDEHPTWKKFLREYPTYNAVSETVDEKASFQIPFQTQRLLVPATGFFEKGHWFRRKDAKIYAMAGLWDRWERHGTVIESCTVLTCPANTLLASVDHHRMPVILEGEEAHELWLDPNVTTRESLKALLVSFNSERMVQEVLE